MTHRTSPHAALLAAGFAAAGCGRLDPAPRQFSHDQVFVVTGSHQGFACEQCHAPTAGSFTHARGGCECFQCHKVPDVTPAHAAVPGYLYAYDACLACHKDGKAGGLPANHPFPVAQGTKHAGIPCAQCHGATKAKADLKCNACHGGVAVLDSNHAGITGYSSASPSCYGCHPQGAVNVNHAALTPFPVTHGATSCSQCHGATKAKADLKCNACHGGVAVLDSKHAGITGYSRASPSCYDCHPQGTVNVNHAAFSPFPITHGGATSCAQCHGATKGPQDLRCYDCHDAPASHSGFSGFQRRSSVQCYTCHLSGQRGN